MCAHATEQLASDLRVYQCQWIYHAILSSCSHRFQDLTCNVNGGTPAAGNCAVNAGDVLAAEMHQQPGDRSCTDEAIGGDHWGPTLIYMAST